MIKICRLGKRVTASACVLLYILMSFIPAFVKSIDVVTLSLIVDLVTLGLILGIVGLYEKTFNDDAVNRDIIKPTPRLVSIVIPYLTLLVCLVSIANYLISINVSQVGMTSRSQSLSEAPLASTLFLTILVAPFFEETLFRYVMFDFFIDRNSTKKVIMRQAIFTSVIFAAFHGTVAHLITGVTFGLFMCYVMYWTDSIGLCAFLHVVNNAFTSMILGATGLSQIHGATAFIIAAGLFLFVIIGLVIFGATADHMWHDTELEWEHPLDHDRLASKDNANVAEFTMKPDLVPKSRYILFMASLYAKATGLIVMPIFGKDLTVYYLFANSAKDFVNMAPENGELKFLDLQGNEVTKEEVDESRNNHI